MVHFPRWKIVLVLLISLAGVLYALPNALPRATMQAWQASVPDWLPGRQVNLGLDLQGGVHLLWKVDWEPVVESRLESVAASLPQALREAGIGYVDRAVSANGISFRLLDASQADQAKDVVADLDSDLDVTIEAPDEGSDQGPVIRAGYSEEALAALRKQLVEQSIEIVRRRIDETGTREPIIQAQGEDRILTQVPGEDDPQRIKDLVGTTAAMTFQLVDEETSVQDARAGRMPAGDELVADRDKDANGDPVAWYVVRKRNPLEGDHLTDAQPTFQQGRPVVSFRFDSIGARRFADITEDNVGRRFAIILDGEVISAPVIRSAILGGSGIIEGGFTVQSATDLALLLRAGALPANLTVLEERSVGPGLGADSIQAGKLASVVGFVAVVVFMFVCYGLFGLFADVALIFNLALILAGLSVLQATLTLPGIAGIVLTVGMAVDANVLIFERVREEVRQGRSPISAIDAGYSRALTTIVDSNVTTLVAGILLFALGSGPVKGFAVTLSLGIVSSMFTAIMLTRLMVVFWLKRARPKSIPI